jgi:hypothetical protein
MRYLLTGFVVDTTLDGGNLYTLKEKFLVEDALYYAALDLFMCEALISGIEYADRAGCL